MVFFGKNSKLKYSDNLSYHYCLIRNPALYFVFWAKWIVLYYASVLIGHFWDSKLLLYLRVFYSAVSYFDCITLNTFRVICCGIRVMFVVCIYYVVVLDRYVVLRSFRYISPRRATVCYSVCLNVEQWTFSNGCLRSKNVLLITETYFLITERFIEVQLLDGIITSELLPALGTVFNWEVYNIYLISSHING